MVLLGFVAMLGLSIIALQVVLRGSSNFVKNQWYSSKNPTEFLTGIGSIPLLIAAFFKGDFSTGFSLFLVGAIFLAALGNFITIDRPVGDDGISKQGRTIGYVGVLYFLPLFIVMVSIHTFSDLDGTQLSTFMLFVYYNLIAICLLIAFFILKALLTKIGGPVSATVVSASVFTYVAFILYQKGMMGTLDLIF